VAELERVRALFPLRCAQPTLAEGEQLLTRSQLKKAGFSDAAVDEMAPAAEWQNRISLQWYRLYKVKIAGPAESPV